MIIKLIEEGKSKMGMKYDDDIVKLIVMAVFAARDQIAKTDYYKVMDLTQTKVTKEELARQKNMIRKIGGVYDYDSKLEEGEGLVAVLCTDFGDEGIIFSERGIYYRCKKSEPVFTKYEYCRKVSSVKGLENDENFSQKELTWLFDNLAKARKIIISRKESEQDALHKELVDFRKKIEQNPDFFGWGDEDIDRINNCIQTLGDSGFKEQQSRKKSPFRVLEKLKEPKIWKQYQRELNDLTATRQRLYADRKRTDRKNKGAAFAGEVIRYALEQKFFLSQSFDDSYIYTERYEIINKASKLLLGNKQWHSRVEYWHSDDSLVALVDLTEGNLSEGIIFWNDELLFQKEDYSYQFVFYPNYVRFSKSDISNNFDPRKLNYVIDKAYRISNGYE